ncbi:MAG TPA: hypothetical protein VKZ49_05855 [Polyangiaceae bacterium]|nr:hypothetical protein [Polyangiaceae bacterium]
MTLDRRGKRVLLILLGIAGLFFAYRSFKERQCVQAGGRWNEQKQECLADERSGADQ